MARLLVNWGPAGQYDTSQGEGMVKEAKGLVSKTSMRHADFEERVAPPPPLTGLLLLYSAVP